MKQLVIAVLLLSGAATVLAEHDHHDHHAHHPIIESTSAPDKSDTRSAVLGGLAAGSMLVSLATLTGAVWMITHKPQPVPLIVCSAVAVTAGVISVKLFQSFIKVFTRQSKGKTEVIL